jgi:hypothetical protein
VAQIRHDEGSCQGWSLLLGPRTRHIIYGTPASIGIYGFLPHEELPRHCAYLWGDFMRRLVPALLVTMIIALGACSATSQKSTRPASTPTAPSAGASSTSASGTEPVSPTRETVKNTTVTVPLGKAGKACLLTVDQAAQVMETNVKAVNVGKGHGKWDEECVYSSSNITAAEISHLTQDQLLALTRKERDIQMLLACGPDTGNGLSPGYSPIPDSPVPGAVSEPNLPGLAFAPLSGGCWFGVTLEGGWGQSEERTAVLKILKVSVAGWRG